jgi:hypothetical protein
MPVIGGGCVVRFSTTGNAQFTSNEAEVLITVPTGIGTLADTATYLEGIRKWVDGR